METSALIPFYAFCILLIATSADASLFAQKEDSLNYNLSAYKSQPGLAAKIRDNRFSVGIRQSELEEDTEFYHNFVLYNKRPGTWQRMPMFLYLGSSSRSGSYRQRARLYQRRPLYAPPGHKVMGHHYHVGLVKRQKELGGFDNKLNDVATVKEP